MRTASARRMPYARGGLYRADRSTTTYQPRPGAPCIWLSACAYADFYPSFKSEEARLELSAGLREEVREGEALVAVH